MTRGREHPHPICISLRWIPTVTAFPRNDVWKIWNLFIRLSLREATNVVTCRSRRQLHFATLDSHGHCVSSEWRMEDLGFIFSACHSEEQHRCDVGIKAKPHFCYTGFPRSLRSLGMTYGRFWIYFFRLSLREATNVATWQSRRSRITLLLNQSNLGSKFQWV